MFAANRGVLPVLAVLLLFVIGQASAQKRIALTYDDAPRGNGLVFDGPQRTTALIDALQSVNSGPVAFFVTTRSMKDNSGNRQRIEQYAGAGHLIANHSHTHQWAHKTLVDDYLKDIDQATALLAGLENQRPWYRFPFLDEGRSADKVKNIARGLAQRGLVNGYVTIDNYDWYLDSRLQQALKEGTPVNYEKLGQFYVRMLLYAAEFYDSLAVQMLGHSPTHVLLLHENDLAALYSDDLITALRAAGWQVVSPDVAYRDPLPVPKTLFTGQGRVFALAADAGRSRNTMWTWALDEEMIDLMLRRSGAFGAEKTQH